MTAFTLLAGGGAVAVASLGPDASDLPVRQVIDKPLQALPLGEQRADLAQLQLFRSDVTRSNDSADSLLSRLGVADATAAQFLRQDPLVKQHLLARAGRNLQASANAQQQLTELLARWPAEDGRQFKRLRVTRQANGSFTSELQEAPMQVSTQMASGVIHTSLFAATDEARIPDSVANQLADIFSGDIDFYRALRKGDRFSVVMSRLKPMANPCARARCWPPNFSTMAKPTMRFGSKSLPRPKGATSI